MWLEADRPTTIRTDLTFARRHVLGRDEIEGFTAQHRLERLQAGEREALLLCSKLKVSVLLTDDLAVRRAAKAQGLTPVGSLGIIAKAHYAGRIARETAERYLRELQAVSSLFVTPAIVDLAIARLRE